MESQPTAVTVNRLFDRKEHLQMQVEKLQHEMRQVIDELTTLNITLASYTGPIAPKQEDTDDRRGQSFR